MLLVQKFDLGIERLVTTLVCLEQARASERPDLEFNHPSAYFFAELDFGSPLDHGPTKLGQHVGVQAGD
jgi:hypothetical protein